MPEDLEMVKEVQVFWADDGNHMVKIYVDCTDRMDTIAFRVEVEGLARTEKVAPYSAVNLDYLHFAIVCHAARSPRWSRCFDYRSRLSW